MNNRKENSNCGNVCLVEKQNSIKTKQFNREPKKVNVESLVKRIIDENKEALKFLEDK